MPSALRTISRNQYAPFFGDETLPQPAQKTTHRGGARQVKSLAPHPTVRDELLMAELNDFKGSVAIVVSSCDAFFDAWRPFAAFLHKFWPDCPFDTFLVTNALDVRSPRIQALPVGQDQGWSSNLLGILKQLSHPYVLY